MLSQDQGPAEERLIHKGHTYYRMNAITTSYHVSEHKERTISSSLIDGGANGGFGGADVRVIEYTDRYADVTGIDGHAVKNIPIATVAGKVHTTRGPIIAIMHQYAYYGKGHSIHSTHQMGWLKLDVDDRSVHCNGQQRIKTPDGYIIPLRFEDGIPTLPMSKPTDTEMDSLPHVFFTSDEHWDPSCLDHTFSSYNGLFDPHPALEENDAAFEHFDQRVTLDGSFIHPDTGDEYPEHFSSVRDRAQAHIANHKVKRLELDYEGLRSCFAWAPIEVIKRTIALTTQYFRNTFRLPLRKHFKSRFPAANVPRRAEAVATDTIISDVPAHGQGFNQAQLYVGRKTLVTDAYPLRSQAEIPRTLEDNIKERGAMETLISNGAKAANSNRAMDLLRLYHIKHYLSEPHHQHQNFAENRIGTLKDITNKVMDRTGCPPSMWYLVLCYVCYIMNFMACKSLGWEIPIALLWGHAPDISFLMCFSFWEPVLFSEDNHFPSSSPERSGRFVGFAPNVGDILTFKILTDDTHEVIYRSAVRTRLSATDPNRRLDPFGGETDQPVAKPVQSFIRLAHQPDDLVPTEPQPLQGSLTPDELIGRSFLLEPDEDGKRSRAIIVRKLVEHDNQVTKLLVEVPDSKVDRLMDYHDLLDALQSQSFKEDGEEYFHLTHISAHQGPLDNKDKHYMGSKWNVLVHWEDGSDSYEPLHIMAKDAPDLMAQYALEKGLLDEDGWKQFRRRARNQKVLKRKVNQHQLQHKRFAPVYIYGVQIPKSADQARELDKANGNTLWADADYAELKGLFEYDFAKDNGPGDTKPYGYQRIRCRMIYAVKHDGRHKARFVAGGHLTPEPEDSVYSGVVSNRSLRIVLLAAELNGLQLMGADITMAYLEALTKEKIYFVAGKEFSAFGLEGHTLILFKALYGLRSSGQAWHSHFAITLKAEGFTPSKADPDVWMRMTPDGSLWEYVCVYVDDLCIAMKNGKTFLDKLKLPPDKGGYGYSLKGDGPLTFDAHNHQADMMAMLSMQIQQQSQNQLMQQQMFQQQFQAHMEETRKSNESTNKLLKILVKKNAKKCKKRKKRQAGAEGKENDSNRGNSSSSDEFSSIDSE